MPIYLFQCEDCNKPSELIMKPDEISEAKCRHCGSENVYRAFTSHADYTIKGNNSASTRPNRLRGSR